MSAAARRERVRLALAARGWEGAVTTPGPNFTYLTGASIERSERLTCLGLPVEGDPWFVCPAFETERLGEALPGAEIVSWEEDEDPHAKVAERMRAAGGTWAIEPSTAYHDAARLTAAAAGVELVDGAAAFEEARRNKDPEEIEALRRAIDAAWEVYDRVIPTLARGDTEVDVADRIAAAFAERGFEAWSLVQFGPGSAVPHGEPGSRALDAPQAVLIDWGGWKDGFTADLTRTVWWDDGAVVEEGGPAPFRSVLDLVRSAQRAALERMRPGVACGDVDAAARDVIRAAGHGERFTHRLGHGLGREIHEAPYLVAGSDDPLRVGDVVTVEPGVYLPGRFGVRWEDDVRVVENGVEVLSRR